MRQLIQQGGTKELRPSGEWPKPTISEFGPGAYEKRAEAYHQVTASADSLEATSINRELIGLGIAVLLICCFVVGVTGLALRLSTDKVGDILVAPEDALIRRAVRSTWSWLRRWWAKSAMRRLLVLEVIAIAIALMLSARRGALEEFAESQPLAYMLIVVTVPAGWVLRKPISRWLDEVTR